MIFKNPDILWFLLALPPLLFGLSFWGWRRKKETTAVFPLNLRRLRIKQIEKYIIAGVLAGLLITALALPEIAYSAPLIPQKTGEIALLVDVSTSMAAQKNPYSPSRLDRVKPVLFDIIDSMEELGQVRISLYGFTDIARSLTPFVGKEDYPYLRESINKVLDVNSIPGGGSSLRQAILTVADKFSEDARAKLIIIFSDGEFFNYYEGVGMNDSEKVLLEQAMRKAIKKGIKVITVGVGETEGAKIPLYDSDGIFTGDYDKLRGIDYVSYLEEGSLKEIAYGTGGKYFFEDNLNGLTGLIKKNLYPVSSEGVTNGVKSYHYISYWFLLAALPVWAVFAKRHILSY